MPHQAHVPPASPAKNDIQGFGSELASVIRENLALLGIAVLVIGYLCLLRYGAYVNFAIPIHQGSVALLLPWMMLNVVVIVLVALASLAAPLLIGSLQLPSGQSVRAALWPPQGHARHPARAVRHWLGMFALPVVSMLGLSLAVLALAEAPIPDSLGWLVLVVPPLIGSLLFARIFGLRWTWSSLRVLSGYIALTFFGLLMAAVHLVVIGGAIVRHAQMTTNSATALVWTAYVLGIIALSALWYLVPAIQLRRPHAQWGIWVAMALAALLTLTPASSFFARNSLAMMGAGGIAIQIRLTPPTGSGNTEWSDPLLLLLDTGGTLMLRSCNADHSDRAVRHVEGNTIHESRRVPDTECALLRPPKPASE